jgi:hypothetical protein
MSTTACSVTVGMPTAFVKVHVALTILPHSRSVLPGYTSHDLKSARHVLQVVPRSPDGSLMLMPPPIA